MVVVQLWWPSHGRQQRWLNPVVRTQDVASVRECIRHLRSLNASRRRSRSRERSLERGRERSLERRRSRSPSPNGVASYGSGGGSAGSPPGGGGGDSWLFGAGAGADGALAARVGHLERKFLRAAVWSSPLTRALQTALLALGPPRHPAVARHGVTLLADAREVRRRSAWLAGWVWLTGCG